LQIGIDDDPSTTVSKIAAKARLWKRKHGLDLLLIDYLQLIEPEDRRINREQQVSVISRMLKKIAMQLSIPVVCLAQLNRLVENRPGNVPKLSDLRESGSLEQDANCVILIHRPEFYKDDDRPGEADLYVAKNRNGKTGVVKLQFEKSTISFRDLARGMSHYGMNEFA
jgi:replicative DNA helicase